MKHIYHLLCTIVICLLPSACSNSDKSGNDTADSVPMIILDTDIGGSTDDLFAMLAAYDYANHGKCRLLGIVVARPGNENAALADVMNTYFGYGAVPIGLVRQGVDNTVVWSHYLGILQATDKSGRRLFDRSIDDYNTLPDGYKLYRRLLSDAPDHSVTICSLGFVTCIAQLLGSGADEFSSLTGVELVRRKVNRLCIMAGSFNGSTEPDYNLGQCLDYSMQMFSLWPSDTEIIFCPCEVGDNLLYDVPDVVADYAWTKVHPIKYVYERCTVDPGQRLWDYIALIDAVEGIDEPRLSPKGTFTLHPDSTTSFTPDATKAIGTNGAAPSSAKASTGVSISNCRYQLPYSADEEAAMLSKLRALTRRF